MLSDLPPQTDPRVLIDFRTSDDAGVYAWEGGPALVQTVDFFTPIVDDPFTYGQIAAANALSDIYAMGGRPVTALAIAGFPDGLLDVDTIRQIFLGGLDKLREAGVALLGGHTVRDPEIKFGYAVTGAIDPERIFTNAGARAGDVLVLTKPLGTGIVGTAIKFDRAPGPAVRAAIASMTALNARAADVLAPVCGRRARVHGHYRLRPDRARDRDGCGERRSPSTFNREICPLLEGVRDLASTNRSGGMGSNREHFAAGTSLDTGVDPALVDVAFDPQTSGGLLVAVAAGAADAILAAMTAASAGAAVVGRVSAAGAFRVRLL